MATKNLDAFTIRPQAAITLRIDDGDILIAQQDELGNDPAVIVITADSVNTLAERLLHLGRILHRDDAGTAPPSAPQHKHRADRTAADRSRRYRHRKRDVGTVTP